MQVLLFQFFLIGRVREIQYNMLNISWKPTAQTNELMHYLIYSLYCK